MVDGYAKSPRPLDRRIASLALRTRTNNPTDGYDLSMSAEFGKERVILKIDGMEIDVAFSLNSATVDLQFDNCEAAMIDDQRSVENWKQTTSEATNFGSKRNIAGAIGVDVTATPAGLGGKGAARAQFAAQSSVESTTAIQRKIVQGDFHRLGSDAVKVGRPEIKAAGTDKTLHGPVVSDFVGWHVKPKKGVVSRVTARLRVRADWINFDDVQYGTPPSKWRHKIEELLKPERRVRKRHFQILLKHLAQTELKDHQDDREATIAAAVLIVKPTDEYPTSAATGEQRREIIIPSHPIEQFLASEQGHEAGTLIGLGVQRESIPFADVEDSVPPKRRRVRDEAFVPESSPVNVASLFAALYKKPTMLVEEVPQSRNEVRDLRSLGLVSRKPGCFEMTAPKAHVDPEFILRRAVSEMPSIKVARAVLRVNPSASGVDIADAVALELGKDWKVFGTKKRNGNAIKRWTVWLEPHLIDASVSGEAAALVSYATKDTAIRGRPPIFDQTGEDLARKMLDDGNTPAEIAAYFKVTRQTIYAWKKRRGL